MATETTRLLNGCVINMPKENDDELFVGNLTKGLSLEELMPFDSDPWWKNVRKTFFLSYWATVIVIFAWACIISIYQHGSCASYRNQMINSNMTSTGGVNGTILLTLNAITGGGPTFAV